MAGEKNTHMYEMGRLMGKAHQDIVDACSELMHGYADAVPKRKLRQLRLRERARRAWLTFRVKEAVEE